MTQETANFQALANDILELSKTYRPEHAPGSEPELVSKCKELIVATQAPMDHGMSLITRMVEASAIRTLMSLKVLQSLPTYGSISLTELETITGAQAALL